MTCPRPSKRINIPLRNISRHPRLRADGLSGFCRQRRCGLAQLVFLDLLHDDIGAIIFHTNLKCGNVHIYKNASSFQSSQEAKQRQNKIVNRTKLRNTKIEARLVYLPSSSGPRMAPCSHRFLLSLFPWWSECLPPARRRKGPRSLPG